VIRRRRRQSRLGGLSRRRGQRNPRTRLGGRGPHRRRRRRITRITPHTRLGPARTSRLKVESLHPSLQILDLTLHLPLPKRPN
jgi:hypothetical protein